MRRLFILAGMVAGTLLGSLAAAGAQQPMQRVQVGVLECRGGASVGFIVGSVTNLGCVLHVDGRPEDRYIATIRKVGDLEGVGFRMEKSMGIDYSKARPQKDRLNDPVVQTALAISNYFRKPGTPDINPTAAG